MAEEKEKEKEVLYDADAQMRIPFTTVFDGEGFKVAHLFNAPDDDSIIEFADADDSPDKMLDFWKRFFIGAEGYEIEGVEPAPESLAELAELIPDQDKVFTIDEALLATRLIKPQLATSRKLRLTKQPRPQRHKLGVFFDGDEVITEHFLGAAGISENKLWESLQRGSLPFTHEGQRITSKSRGMLNLYARLSVSATGYVGRIPAHHKMVVIAAHMHGQHELLLGK